MKKLDKIFKLLEKEDIKIKKRKELLYNIRDFFSIIYYNIRIN